MRTQISFLLELLYEYNQAKAENSAVEMFSFNQNLNLKDERHIHKAFINGEKFLIATFISCLTNNHLHFQNI